MQTSITHLIIKHADTCVFPTKVHFVPTPIECPMVVSNQVKTPRHELDLYVIIKEYTTNSGRKCIATWFIIIK